MDWLVPRLAGIPGVVAVALGGSRATGQHQRGSDWDFGLYYRGTIDTNAIRELGYDGTVVEPGTWGRLVNGGAWLTIDGERVDLLYRDLDVVEHWTREAEAGRFERDLVEGYIAGMPTYVLTGELALNRVLHGSLPSASYPPALVEAAPPRWFDSARFSVAVAETFARRDDAIGATGLLMKGIVAAAHGVLARRGEWALNEKHLATKAGLGGAAGVALETGAPLEDRIAAVRALVEEVIG